ncbi:MAG: dUTP diphosphatase [Rectinemataceae bacterium]
MMIKVCFKKLNQNAEIPRYGYRGDAGLDFFAVDDVVIPAHESIDVGTGVAWQAEMVDLIGDECGWHPYLQLKGRSGMSIKNGVELCNAGVIDWGYRGEIRVKLYNTSGEAYEIKRGDRIAQGIVYLVPEVRVIEVEELSISERGDRGFGSSGR